MPALATPPVTETVHEHGGTETFVDVAPTCEEGGPLYTITITFNLVEHSTVFADGRVHATFTQTGTFVGVPFGHAGPGASGHFAVWGGFNQNNKTVNGTFTFNVNGEFDDGTQISTHVVEHFNVTPTGAEFFFTHCHDRSFSTAAAAECPGLPTVFAGVAVTLTDKPAHRFEGAGCSFYYDSNDLFQIEGVVTDLASFEEALNNGTVSADIVGGVYDADPTDMSLFDITTDNDP